MVPRYLIDFELDKLPQNVYDFIVIGSGVAGLWTALKASPYGKVAILTKSKIDESTTKYAQGGIAVAFTPFDAPELHLADTISCGAGLVDLAAARVLVKEGPKQIEELILLGVSFDKTDERYALGREGGHSRRRILHSHGDATGEEIERVLVKAISGNLHIDVFEHSFAIDLLTKGDNCVGVLALNRDSGEISAFLSKATFLCSGGVGQLYKVTTNPAVATGDGLGMAYRAGAQLMDMEFVQFHPTALYDRDEERHFLVSEAVRGEGGRLVNLNGERFMPRYHPEADLAPRDVVTRAIVEEMNYAGVDRVFLDVSDINPDRFQERFPTIYELCQRFGLDIRSDFIPVTPAAHYLMGGVRTSLSGAANLSGLYAIGEVACTGVHGANRLASNSLLEGLVFSEQAAESARDYINSLGENFLAGLKLEFKSSRKKGKINVKSCKTNLKELMWTHLGIIRTGEGLRGCIDKLKDLSDIFNVSSDSPEGFELQNLLLIGQLMARAALQRKESRGAHFREDFPKRNDARWKRHIVLKSKE